MADYPTEQTRTRPQGRTDVTTTPRYDPNPTVDTADPDAYVAYAADLDKSNPGWEWDNLPGMARELAIEAYKRRNPPDLATGGPVSTGTRVRIQGEHGAEPFRILPPGYKATPDETPLPPRPWPTATDEALRMLTKRVDDLEDQLDEQLMDDEYEGQLLEGGRSWQDVAHTLIIAAAIVAAFALLLWGAK